MYWEALVSRATSTTSFKTVPAKQEHCNVPATIMQYTHIVLLEPGHYNMDM